MSKAKQKDRAKAINELVGELGEMLDEMFNADNLYDLSCGGISCDGTAPPIDRWIDRFRVLFFGHDSVEPFDELMRNDRKLTDLVEDAAWAVRRDDSATHFVTGYLLGQARAGVPMAEIKRQCRAMLERS